MTFSICCRPEILLPLQRDVTTSLLVDACSVYDVTPELWGMWGTTLFLLFVMLHVGGNKYNFMNHFPTKSFSGKEAFNLQTGKFMILLIGTSFVFCTVLSYNS